MALISKVNPPSFKHCVSCDEEHLCYFNEYYELICSNCGNLVKERVTEVKEHGEVEV